MIGEFGLAQVLFTDTANIAEETCTRLSILLAALSRDRKGSPARLEAFGA